VASFNLAHPVDDATADVQLLPAN